jgi:hypothetical protein
MDQIAFWDNALVISCHAPIGGYALGRKKFISLFFDLVTPAHNFSFSHSGQPRTRTANVDSKHIVYTAFCVDGSCLPLFIVTGKKVSAAHTDGFHTDGNPDHRAYVVYRPNIKQSSGELTEIWLEHMCKRTENYLPADSSIVMDVATWHVSKEMIEVWNQRRINTFFLPAASGRWLNPCEQSMHREMRRAFTQLQQHNPRDKLKKSSLLITPSPTSTSSSRGSTHACWKPTTRRT